MTKRDFFRTIIKLFGLYQLLIVVFQGVPRFLEIVYFDVTIPFIFYASIILGITISLFVILLFKVDTIINWLRLEQGFDEERIQFSKFKPVQIINLAIILISGTMILNYIPEFLIQSYQAFKTNAGGNGINQMLGNFSNTTVDYFSWSVSGINVIVGYFMLTNYPKLAKWLDSKTTISTIE